LLQSLGLDRLGLLLVQVVHEQVGRVLAGLVRLPVVQVARVLVLGCPVLVQVVLVFPGLGRVVLVVVRLVVVVHEQVGRVLAGLVRLPVVQVAPVLVLGCPVLVQVVLVLPGLRRVVLVVVRLVVVVQVLVGPVLVVLVRVVLVVVGPLLVGLVLVPVGPPRSAWALSWLSSSGRAFEHRATLDTQVRPTARR
jgi:hypothetical protein